MAFFLALFLQVLPQFPLPDLPPGVGGEIEGPYIFREDLGQTTKVILKNGLTVLVRENNGLPLASITLAVRAGSFDESPGQYGISHLIQHMLFRGTADRGLGQAVRQMGALGAKVGAYTDYDRTVFESVVPSANVIAAMEIQADSFWNAEFDAEELAREKRIVAEESYGDLEDPHARAVERLYGTAFNTHPIRRSRLASAADLPVLTADDVVAHYERYYQPSNVILSVVGRFERESMLDEVLRIHGSQTDIAVERDVLPVEGPQSSFRYNWERGEIAEAQIAFGFHVPEPRSDDTYALEVISALLTAGRASRMNSYLRDEQGVISRASSSLMGFDGLGYFQLTVEAADPEQAEIAVLTEFERLRRYGVTEEQLSRAKTLVAQDYYHRIETVEGVADELVRQELLGGWKRMNRFLEGIQAVSTDDVERSIDLYFQTENLGLFEYLPPSVSRSYSDDDFRTNVLNQIPENFVERSIEELPVSGTIHLLDDELVHDVLGAPVRRSILRGPDVYILEDHRLPLVSFGIFYPGGRLLESASNAGITELTLRSALRGTRRYNSLDISRRLENAGARIEVVNEPDFFGYVLDGVSGQIGEALNVLMDVLQEPTFTELVVERERGLQLSRLGQGREHGAEYPMQLAMGALFETHAYGRSAYGLESSLEAITRDDLVEWHGQNQRTVVPLIVIVGDVRGTGLVAEIAETLTNEDLFERDISNLPSPRIGPEASEAVEMGSRRGTAMVYGFPGPVYAGGDHTAMTLLGNVLSGMGGRLDDTVREGEALAYPLGANGLAMVRSGAFLISAVVQPGDEGPVRDSIEAEIARLIANGISEEELERASNYTVGAHEVELQTRRARAMAFARAIYAGADMDLVTDFESRVRLVGRDDIQAAAEKYLDLSTAKVTIIRGQN